MSNFLKGTQLKVKLLFEPGYLTSKFSSARLTLLMVRIKCRSQVPYDAGHLVSSENMLATLVTLLLFLLDKNVFRINFYASEINISIQKSTQSTLNMLFLTLVTQYKAWMELNVQNL